MFRTYMLMSARVLCTPFILECFVDIGFADDQKLHCISQIGY
jgi:hypothetical protein